MGDLPTGNPDYARITKIDHNKDAFVAIFTDGINGSISMAEITQHINSRSKARDSAKHLGKGLKDHLNKYFKKNYPMFS
jgi:serine/threonine protein phosphatase PrpC